MAVVPNNGPVLPKFSVTAVQSAKTPEALAMLWTNVSDLYRLLNGLFPAVPNGLVLFLANEGTGAGVWDNTTGGTANLRTLASAGSYATGLLVAASTTTINFTLVPAAIALSAFATPTSSVSMGGYTITNLGNPVNPTDGVNLQTVTGLVGATARIPGPSGEDGEDGPMGPPGPPGPPGLGITGPTGLQGAPGIDGDPGEDSWVPGPVGAQGVPGPVGATGPQGIMGFPGMDGDPGDDGWVGPRGPAGTNGSNGATGATGPRGMPGEDGAPVEDVFLTGIPTFPTNAVPTDSSNQVATDAFVQSAIGAVGAIANDFRLSGTQYTFYPAADVATVSTLYYNPRGVEYNNTGYGRVTLATAGGVLYTILSQPISLTLSGLTLGLCYDIFVKNNGSGSLVFDTPLAWSGASTRATALSTVNGLITKSGDPTRLYVGTIYTTSTTATADTGVNVTSTPAYRYIFNAYNQMLITANPFYGGVSNPTGVDTAWHRFTNGVDVQAVFGLPTRVIMSGAVTYANSATAGNFTYWGYGVNGGNPSANQAAGTQSSSFTPLSTSRTPVLMSVGYNTVNSFYAITTAISSYYYYPGITAEWMG